MCGTRLCRSSKQMVLLTQNLFISFIFVTQVTRSVTPLHSREPKLYRAAREYENWNSSSLSDLVPSVSCSKILSVNTAKYRQIPPQESRNPKQWRPTRPGRK